MIDIQRTRIGDLLDQMPSLRSAIESNLVKAYPRAVRRAARETTLPPATLPPACPFAVSQLLDEEFFLE